MAKNCKKQLSGAENRKKAKIKAIKTANVLSKVPKLNAYFNVKHAVNSTENTSSINIYYTYINYFSFSFHARYLFIF